MSAPPLLRSTVAGNRLELAAAGSWTVAHAAAIEQAVDAARGEMPGVQSVAIDVADVGELDTFGAWLLERLARAGAERGQKADLLRVPGHYQGLLDEVRRANHDPAPAPPRKNIFSATLESLGRTLSAIGSDFLAFADLFGALCVAVGRVALRPRTFRLTSTVNQLDRVGWRAVGIIVLITFLIGAIIAQQGFFHFRKFGADDYVVDLVGVLVTREIGVLLVAIMVAGRSGSSYTAELGSMKMREEIDALRTMGLDPTEVLLLPRVVALIIALPILTFLGCMAALLGGGIVADFYGGMSPPVYLARLRDAVTITHFEVGMLKAPFMALVIGVIACMEGLRVQGSSESLGLHTTASVVKAIFMVIVLDGVFAIFFASIGM